MYLTPLYANPRRRRRYSPRRRRRRNPEYGFEASAPRRSYRTRSNPTILGVDLGDAGGTILGGIGTAYVDSALVTPLAGQALSAAGSFKPAVQAVISAFGFHWLMRRMSPRWARQTAGGGALYAAVGVANTIAPGLVPITIGVPTQLAGLSPLGMLGAPKAAAPATGTAAATVGSGAASGGTVSQTGGLRVMSRNGL